MKSELIRLKLEKLKTDHPRFPVEDLPKPKYSDKSSNGLTNMVIDYITLTGYQAERISNTGRWIDTSILQTDVIGRTKRIGNGKYIPGTGTKGSADISATIKGRSVKIEVKIKYDKPSPDQIKYKESIESAGGVYVLAKTFDEFYQWYHNFLNQIK